MNVDRSLLRLILVIAWLNGMHTLDHVIRGDFHWPLDGQSIGFVLAAAVYLVIGMGSGLSRRSTCGITYITSRASSCFPVTSFADLPLISPRADLCHFLEHSASPWNSDVTVPRTSLAPASILFILGGYSQP